MKLRLMFGGLQSNATVASMPRAPFGSTRHSAWLDVYAVSAYILSLNGLLAADATLDAKSLRAIRMPNRSMFVGDPRPDVKNSACMTGC
jgi:hypothetical protein